MSVATKQPAATATESAAEMLSVIIPAYNEADTITGTVEAIVAALDVPGWDYEILVVNDGSGDATEAALQALHQRFGRVRHVNNEQRHGYGYAVRCGLENFRGDAAVVVMADGSEEPKDIVTYFERIRDGHDCCFGSRFIDGAVVEDYPRFKLVINRIGNWFLGLIMGQKYGDFTNGFKCFRRHVIEDMQPLVSGQFNLTVEMSIKAIASGADFAVVPTAWRNRDAGVSKFNVWAQVKLYVSTILYCVVQTRVVPRIGKPAR